MFRQIVKDIFSGLPDPPASQMAMSAHSRSYDVDSALDATATEMGLVSHKLWRDKCLQLYNISQVHQGETNSHNFKTIDIYLKFVRKLSIYYL